MKASNINTNEYLAHPVLLHLEKITGITPANVPIRDEALYGNLPGDVAYIPELGTAFMQGLISKTGAHSFDDLIKLVGLGSGTGTWKNNAEILIESGGRSLSEVIADREDIISRFEENGIEQGMARAVTARVYRAEAHRNGFDNETEALLREHNIPDWYIESCKKIEYLSPRALALSKLNVAVRLMWFKLHHPAAIDAIAIPPELGKSRARVYSIEGDRLRLPYISIDGIGRKVAERLEAYSEPKENYASFRDVQKKIGLSPLYVDALYEAGLLDGVGE